MLQRIRAIHLRPIRDHLYIPIRKVADICLLVYRLTKKTSQQWWKELFQQKFWLKFSLIRRFCEKWVTKRRILTQSWRINLNLAPLWYIFSIFPSLAFARIGQSNPAILNLKNLSDCWIPKAHPQIRNHRILLQILQNYYAPEYLCQLMGHLFYPLRNLIFFWHVDPNFHFWLSNIRRDSYYQNLRYPHCFHFVRNSRRYHWIHRQWNGK